MSVRVAVFAMSDATHFNSSLLIAAELAKAGAAVCFWTHAQFAQQVMDAGVQFADVFAHGSLEAADDRSIPAPARFVTHAAVHGREIIADVRAFAPGLVIFDAFAVIARIVATALDVPAVPIISGHAVYGPELRPLIAGGPRVAIDPRCYAAAETLRSEFGLADASPFSYIPDPSVLLNIKCEPAEWYTSEQVEKLGPLAFFGAIPDRAFVKPRPASGRPHIFASFGTIIWRYWTREALETYAAIADAIESLGAVGTISLGGAPVDDESMARLQRPSVRVERYVDQWKTLERSDLFITHHGRGSTHESVACGTPMLSHPFFWDQPALAKRAQELGVAQPLLPGATGQEAVPSVSQAMAAIEAALENLPESHAALLRAQTWERRAIEGRPAFARRILALA